MAIHLPNPDDVALAQKCLAGDSRAWDSFVCTYTPDVFARCYRFTGRKMDAQDAVQEVFLRVFLKLQTYDPSRNRLRNWLLTVATNLLIDRHRQSAADRLTWSFDAVIANQIQGPRRNWPDQVLYHREICATLRLAIGKLPAEMRQPLVLRGFFDMKYEEISQTLGLPLGTVKSRLRRGSQRLARQLRVMGPRVQPVANPALLRDCVTGSR